MPHSDHKLTECPCIDCICLPVCRYKNYRNLLIECETLFSKLYITRIICMEARDSNFVKDIRLIQDFLKPTEWQTLDLGNGIIHINNIHEGEEK